MWNWIILVLLISIGVFDLYLYFEEQKTISQRIHRMFPKWLDISIMIGLLVGVWRIGQQELFIPVMLGVIIGHLFWNE